MSRDLLPVTEFPPEGAELVCEFAVLGRPRPAGSKTAFVPKRGDGSLVRKPNGDPLVVAHDSSGKEGEAWRSEVAAAADRAYEAELDFDVFDEAVEKPLLQGPLALDIVFVLKRPKGHFRTGRNAHLLRDSAPAAPTSKPDALKLARAVEDAISTVVWNDDAQIVDGRQRKVFGTPERAEVRIYALPAFAGGAAADDGQGELLAS